MSTNGSPSDKNADLVTIRTGLSIAPATWVTSSFSLGGIAGIIWQAYASAPAIPPTQLGFIWVLSTMSIISLLGAGREFYIREGLRIASEYYAQLPANRNTVTEVPPDRASMSANDKGPPDNRLAAAETVRPVVVATYEIHEAIDSDDPDEELFELEYLAFHNLGPEAAFNIRIDPIVVAEDDITLFGSAIKLLKRDDTAERQIRGSLIKRIRDARRGSAAGTCLPLNVLYEDRGGREWETLHVIEVTTNGIEIGPVGDRQVYWTKLL